MPTLHQKHFLTHNPVDVSWGLAGETAAIQVVSSYPTAERESKYIYVFLGQTIQFPLQSIFFPRTFFNAAHEVFPLKVFVFTTLKT